MSAPPAVSNPLGNLNTSLPSTRRIQNLIREKAEVQIKLITGEQLAGTILWLDEHCIALGMGDSTSILWIHAIAYLRF
jgi:host factor-I protein